MLAPYAIESCRKSEVGAITCPSCGMTWKPSEPSEYLLERGWALRVPDYAECGRCGNFLLGDSIEFAG